MKREMISIQTKIAGNVDVDDEPINGLAPRRWTTTRPIVKSALLDCPRDPWRSHSGRSYVEAVRGDCCCSVVNCSRGVGYVRILTHWLAEACLRKTTVARVQV
jgi:hypothetical protein